MLDETNKGIIDLNTEAVPAILAGMLDISVPMVYQGRQDGKLPAKKTATYKECIQQYVKFYKNKIHSAAGTMVEAKLQQDIRNGIAKEELQWLQIKQTKEQLVDVSEMKELFEPIFYLVKSSMVNLARKYPELENELDNTLETWYVLGEKIVTKAKQDGDGYVREMLERQIELPIAEDEALSTFGLNELPEQP